MSDTVTETPAEAPAEQAPAPQIDRPLCDPEQPLNVRDLFGACTLGTKPSAGTRA